jgi:hypothetical protein
MLFYLLWPMAGAKDMLFKYKIKLKYTKQKLTPGGKCSGGIIQS